MTKLKRKLTGLLALLFVSVFCMDAVAVDNPISYITEINDCDVIKYNGEYYIQGNWLKGDMLTSRDLESWGERTHVFSWNNTWHTQVNMTDPNYDIHGTHIRYSNGTFHLYAHLEITDGITHATSSNIWGPYLEPVDAPFSGNARLIDPDTFVDDDGSPFYYETNRDGASGHDIRARTMSNLSTLSGSWDFQIRDSQSWEGTIINEGSKVFKYRGRYYMLYNGKGTGDPDYAVGAVEASSPLGFDNSGKYSNNPIVSRVVPAVGKPEIAYIGQAWVVDGINGFEKWFGYFAQTTADGRTQRIDRMHFFYRTLFVDGPTDRYSTGYHPSPAQPEYLGIFNAADGSFPSDWTLQTGTWSITSAELRQTTATGFHNVILDRDPAENLLAEANVKLIGGASTRAGLTLVKDGTDWLRVGFDQTANRWFYERMNDSVYDTGNYALPAGFNYQVYHKIQLQKDGNTVSIKIDDIPSPTLSSLSVNFDGAALPELFTDGAQAAFDGVIYTIGWDEFDSGVDGWGDSIHGLPFVGSRTYGSGGITVNNGFVYKGDLMPEYEFSAQAYQVSGTGSMGLAAVAIDNNNYLNAVINLATDKLVVTGVHGGVGFSEPEISVANKTEYNLRVAKLADRVIIFVDGVEMLTVNKAYGASPVGLIATVDARFNGIMAYETQPATLPAPWTSTDIGSVAFAGSATHHEDWFTVRGSGSGVWGQSNEFQYTHRPLSGDGEIVAQMRVASSKGYWTRMGLMIRESTSPDSKFIMMNVNGANNYIQQISHDVTSPTAGYSTIDFNGSFDMPQWLKISRSGNLFSCYRSNDGTNWTLHGTKTIAMGANVLVGMAVMDAGTTFISKAVFDNVAVTVPLSPGIIGNSQEIYEDENPATFASIESATGNGTVSYQWQQTLTPGNAGSWSNIAGATAETYTVPNQNGVYPVHTEIFVRRKATDDLSDLDSNVVSLKVNPLFNTSGDYLFLDTFNTIDTTDVNWQYASRQAGGGGISTYTDPVDHFSINGNALKNTGFAGLLAMNANMGRYLVGEDFELSFKLTVPDTSANWSSIYLADTPNGRNTTRFGLIAWGSGNANALSIYKGIASKSEVDISVAEMTSLLGSPYNKAEEHTIQLISTAGSGGENTYDLVVDGVVIRSDQAYNFDSDTQRKIEMIGIMNIASDGALYDDISLRHSRTYAKWVEDNNLAGANALRTTDIEPDGLNNLAEYALGGNPTSNDAAAFMPTFEITDVGGGSNVVSYVYNRRLNAASLGLTYGLETSTNLLGAWEYVGTGHETDSVAIDLYYESVTNEISTAGTNQGFVRLEIEEN